MKPPLCGRERNPTLLWGGPLFPPAPCGGSFLSQHGNFSENPGLLSKQSQKEGSEASKKERRLSDFLAEDSFFCFAKRQQGRSLALFLERATRARWGWHKMVLTGCFVCPPPRHVWLSSAPVKRHCSRERMRKNPV
jgi:hypothetical protein